MRRDEGGLRGSTSHHLKIENYLQSGAGHHLESGSESKTRRTMKSSYFFMMVGDVRSSASMSLGCIASEHCVHAISVRDSNISIVK